MPISVMVFKELFVKIFCKRLTNCSSLSWVKRNETREAKVFVHQPQRDDEYRMQQEKKGIKMLMYECETKPGQESREPAVRTARQEYRGAFVNYVWFSWGLIKVYALMWTKAFTDEYEFLNKIS